MIWLRKELKDRLFPTTPFQCGYPQHHFSAAVFSVLKKLTAPTAFAWRAEDGDAQQIQVPGTAGLSLAGCSQTPSGRLLGKALGLFFCIIEHLHERHAQSCFMFPLVGYKQKKPLELWPGLHPLKIRVFRRQILLPSHLRQGHGCSCLGLLLSLWAALW